MNPPSSPEANIEQKHDGFTIVRPTGDGPITWWFNEDIARRAVDQNLLSSPVFAVSELPFVEMDRKCEHIVIVERDEAKAIYDLIAREVGARDLVIAVSWPAEKGHTLDSLVTSGMLWRGCGIAKVEFSADETPRSAITEAASSGDTNTPLVQADGNGGLEPVVLRRDVSDETVAKQAQKLTDPEFRESTVDATIVTNETEPHPLRGQPVEPHADERGTNSSENERRDSHAQSGNRSSDRSSGPQRKTQSEHSSKTAEIDAVIEAMINKVADSEKSASDVLAEFRSSRSEGFTSGSAAPSEAPVAPTEADVDARHPDRTNNQKRSTDTGAVAETTYSEGGRSMETNDDAVEIEHLAQQDIANDGVEQSCTAQDGTECSNDSANRSEHSVKANSDEIAAKHTLHVGERTSLQATSSLAARAAGAVPDDDAVLISANGKTVGPNHHPGRNQPNVDPLSHYLCGEEFARQMGSKIRFTEQWRTWQKWIEGEGWQRDATSIVHHQCGELVKDMSLDAKGRVRAQVQSTGFTQDVVKRVAWRPEICVKDSELWDADPMVLGLPNGLVCDLKSGEVRRAAPDEMITMRAGCVPSETADCPEFLAALDQWTMGDTAYIEHIQRALGYALTGLTTEERLIFIHGGGGNGKSVLAGVVRAAMGDYADVTPEGMFTATKFRGHPTSVASTQGKRLLVASETNSTDVWDAARVKQFTGGDPIRAHFMRQDPFTFTPKFTLMFLANNLPAFEDGVDDAIRRRFLIWPFRFKASASNRDNKLKHRIIENELPGVLRWLIEGCRHWMLNGGLKVPPVVEAETQEYLASQDLFRQFLEDECEIVQGELALSTPLYRQWVRYANHRGEEAGTQTAFGLKLKSAGFEKFQGRVDGKKVRGWRGLRLGRSRENRGD